MPSSSGKRVATTATSTLYQTRRTDNPTVFLKRETGYPGEPSLNEHGWNDGTMVKTI